MHIILQTQLISGYFKHTSRHDLVHASLFSKNFPEVPSHKAFGMAASASAEVRNCKKIVNEIIYSKHNFYRFFLFFL